MKQKQKLFHEIIETHHNHITIYTIQDNVWTFMALKVKGEGDTSDRTSTSWPNFPE